MKLVSITADSPIGRVLIALRAGQMTSGELGERFPSLPRLEALVKKGLITGDAHGWRLTDAGRATCPLRNPLAANINAVPTPALPRITSGKLPTTPRRPPELAITGESEMPQTEKRSAIDLVRALLAEFPNGVSRKELIRKTELTDAGVDNAISKLVKRGEAVRTGYGVITATQTIKQVEALFSTPTAIAKIAPQEPAISTPEVGDVSQIEFSIYDDGRLVIMDGDEVFVLPPSATRRLGTFLGCFDMSQPQQPTAR